LEKQIKNEGVFKMAATLNHVTTGEVKTVPTGFSWTTLFFGFFVPLFRGDILWAAIMLIVGIVTAGISVIIFPFFYNKVYIDSLLKKGYSYKTKTHYSL
jgi:hypothetical protein